MVEAFFGPGGPACTANGADCTCRAPSGEDILVQQLSASQWRVIDRRFPDHDARSLLGFIEESDHRFEVMWIGQGFQGVTFPSLAEALNYFSEPAAGVAPR